MDQTRKRIRTTDEEIEIGLKREKDYNKVKTTDEEITLEFMYKGEQERG